MLKNTCTLLSPEGFPAFANRPLRILKTIKCFFVLFYFLRQLSVFGSFVLSEILCQNTFSLARCCRFKPVDTLFFGDIILMLSERQNNPYLAERL